MKLLALRQRFLPGDFPPEEWERPQPGKALLRRDAWLILAVLAVALLGMEMMLSFAPAQDGPQRVPSYLAMSLMIAPLALRRRFPIISMMVLSAIFLGFGMWVPAVMVQLAPQIAYFVGLYSAVAWARDRRALRLALGGVILAMALWLIVGVTNAKLLFGEALDLPAALETTGFIDPVLAYAGYNFLVNLFYFGGAIFLGMTSWRSAWRHDVVVAQAKQLGEQSAELARRAVIDERLRIARELHDVVAHHISAVGVQAAAARMVQPRDPGRASELMRGIEDSARRAVGETRSLLRVLRHEGADAPDTATRSPEPTIGQLGELAEQSGRAGVGVELIFAEHREGFLDAVGAGLGLALYRIAAESLANVREHSTARKAVLSVRSGVDPHGEWVEVEVTDDGNPRPGTSGGGYGLRGITERAELHHGMVDIGPRSPAGWRTRARLRALHTGVTLPSPGATP